MVEASLKAALSRLAAKEGDFARAGRLLREAFATGTLERESYAEALLCLGEALLSAGKSGEARQCLGSAKEEYSALVQNGYRTRESDKIETLLARNP